MEKKEAQDQEFHFLATSVAEWISTTESRTLPDVVAWMDKAGYPYTLFMVPGHWNSNYTINFYTPQVEGTVRLGHFLPPAERKKEAKRIEKERSLRLDKELWGMAQQT